METNAILTECGPTKRVEDVLKDFWVKHPKAETPLASWYQFVRHAAWRTTAEMLQTWPSADIVERLTVFNIGGNEYRLIARVQYCGEKCTFAQC